MDRKRAVAGLIAALGAFTLSVTAARAQEISARDRQSASEAYTRGTAAYLAEDFADAGRWFETAHRLAPAAAALVQAVRSYERAGNSLRSATLALRLTALYPDDRAGQRAAASALRAAPRLVRVDVECEGCAVQVDGTVMEHPSFFVEPGSEHVVEAAFETGTQRETVQGAAGERRALSFEAPPPPVEPEPLAGDPPVAGEPPPTEQRVDPAPAARPPVPAWVSISALVATAAVGGVLVWSGVDTLDGVPAYEANPTAEALADGQGRELRTNILIGATSALAATTLLLMIFTDWGGAPPQPQGAGDVQASFGIQPDGAMGALRGRF